MRIDLTRRTLLSGAVGTLALSGLAAGCAGSGTAVTPTSELVRRAERDRRGPGQRLVTAQLTPQEAQVDLGGMVVSTWAYGDSVPGPLIRATAGDQVRVAVDNRLSTDTSVHWHGVALRNDMDGVPGVTQDPIGAGERFDYEFTVPDPGTYFYHPHVGVQLDRGLSGVLVVDDPSEPGDYDDEWVVVLDDWVDGTGRTPDDVLAELLSGAADGMDGMEGMDHGSMGGMGMGGPGSSILGDAGDVTYPHYLINGRTALDPAAFRAKAGQRIRVRVVNAATDTAFRLALGGHRLTITHGDGFAVQPVEADSVLLGMGERFDFTVTLGDGVFALVALAEGKEGQAMAVVRTGAGQVPSATDQPAELDGRVVLGTDLVAADAVRLRDRSVDVEHRMVLAGSMQPYRWTVNGKSYPDSDPFDVTAGDRVRLVFRNASMMFHPMHVHGHTFALAAGGARKDTVIVRPMQELAVDLDATNPGQWMSHCHNLYHAEAGMMSLLSYRA